MGAWLRRTGVVGRGGEDVNADIFFEVFTACKFGFVFLRWLAGYPPRLFEHGLYSQCGLERSQCDNVLNT